MARIFQDPFSADSRLDACPCGRDHAPGLACTAEAAPPADGTGALGEAAEVAVMKAVFPEDATRRALLRLFGAGTVMAAIESVFPLATAREALAQAAGAPEKRDLRIGFIPITCATPIIMAHPMNFYSRHGLNVEVIRTAGWAVIRDRAIAREYDAAHMLAPMPLAMSLGVGVGQPQPFAVAAIENINGQAITLANKHRDKRNPRDWRGFRFAVPFDFSIHNYLLRHYVAEHGLDPDRDIQIRAVPPPEMVANLRADNIDGFLGPDPFNQRAVFDGVGFIHILTRELWDGHPCCAFAVPRGMITDTPNTFAALLRAIVEATAYSQKAENRREVAQAIAGQNYLNQPPTVVEQVLTGTFADGLGRVQRVPDRIGFDPFPWHSMAMWILTQMRRWGQLQREVDYAEVAAQTFLALDAGRAMRDLGLPVPASPLRTETIMGRAFDPANPSPWTERAVRA
ncbi:ABC transporter substrate-binding protein [Roseomonas alkaliterrae]|uniref:Nitrate/nitrite transport system substrate-binding protein n=1 Tax=Neoroseomonas alkaliterrae TaxID=1452450 RepID=A0A840Y9G8_9PROT|nr:CmpA/NrtA family ABC transporter substrate-binding protein [Neoroseomonas alkaliterrae]MBB5690663.1 nitrate/nitrite transport system substrate-binding protein [Neoroseomonas alkaliterrae]MBR0676308.1 ABC transporter substrate-binding protein [Neoroseomonas alkaliterrae]